MAVTITYFVHGTTLDNERNKATGWLPGELSPLGINQSKHLGKLITDKHFDVVFCSDLHRAVESAKLAFSSKKIPIIKDSRLRECDYGDLTGKPFNFNLKSYIEKPFPNGESYKDVERRIADFLKFLKKNYNNLNVAIMAHQAPQLALEVLVNGKTWNQAIDEDWRHTKSWRPGWIYQY